MATTVSANNGDRNYLWSGSFKSNSINEGMLPSELTIIEENTSLIESTNPSPISDLGKIIAKKYRSRSLMPTDPSPIMINCETVGPLNVAGGFIMCDACGSIIRKNYLTNHRSSGACMRLAEKRNQTLQDDILPRQNEPIKSTNQRNNNITCQTNFLGEVVSKPVIAPGAGSTYNGPYVHLSNSNDNITTFEETKTRNE